MTAHASLGASSAERWMACPGSPREIAALPDALRDSTSIYAAEGTVAHAILERALNGEEVWKLVGTTYEYRERGQEFDIQITEEMLEAVEVGLHVAQSEMERMGPTARLYVEQRVYPLADRPDMFGTSDIIVVKPWVELSVIDYKHGVGHVVEVEGNPQLKYYGLGALVEHGGPLEFGKVTLTIVQPRAMHEQGRVRSWSLSPGALHEWGDVLRAAADRTRDPNAPLVPGPWCGWCPAKVRCSAFRGAISTHLGGILDANPLPDARPVLPDPSDVAQVARAMALVDMIDAWVRGVQGTCMRLLEGGHKVPGYKLVRKRGNRRWASEQVAEERLRASVPADALDAIYEPRVLKSPAQIEKAAALGGTKKDREALVAQLTIKPDGGLTVVPESDPRDAVEITKAVDVLASETGSTALAAIPELF